MGKLISRIWRIWPIKHWKRRLGPGVPAHPCTSAELNIGGRARLTFEDAWHFKNSFPRVPPVGLIRAIGRIRLICFPHGSPRIYVHVMRPVTFALQVFEV